MPRSLDTPDAVTSIARATDVPLRPAGIAAPHAQGASHDPCIFQTLLPLRRHGDPPVALGSHWRVPLRPGPTGPQICVPANIRNNGGFFGHAEHCDGAWPPLP